jgi:hypothetical protein
MAIHENNGYHPPMTSTDTRAQQKKNLLMLVLLITVLDGAMIGLYYAYDVAHRTLKAQQTFVAIWVMLTLIVVTTMVKRIRLARRRR